MLKNYDCMKVQKTAVHHIASHSPRDSYNQSYYVVFSVTIFMQIVQGTILDSFVPVLLNLGCGCFEWQTQTRC